MATIFSKIIAGEIPSYKITEDDNFYAFLDINPLVLGHTLVVPKNETDYIFDLTENELGNIFVFSKKIAQAIKKSVPCIKISIHVIGLEVPHAHIHLIPINSISDTNFTKEKLKPSADELRLMAEKIIGNL